MHKQMCSCMHLSTRVESRRTHEVSSSLTSSYSRETAHIILAILEPPSPRDPPSLIFLIEWVTGIKGHVPRYMGSGIWAPSSWLFSKCSQPHSHLSSPYSAHLVFSNCKQCHGTRDSRGPSCWIPWRQAVVLSPEAWDNLPVNLVPQAPHCTENYPGPDSQCLLLFLPYLHELIQTERFSSISSCVFFFHI